MQINKSIYIDFFKENLNYVKSQRFSDLTMWKQFNTSNQYIFIFGAGLMGRKVLTYLNKMGVKVDFFCDNDKNKQGLVIIDGKEYRIIDSNQLKEINANNNVLCFIASGTKYINEIKLQLRCLSIGSIVFKDYLDYFLEGCELLFSNNLKCLIDQITHLFNFFEDDESWDILMKHFIIAFDLMSIADIKNKITILNIGDFSHYNKHIPYFIEDKYISEYAIIDCGAYNGDTLKDWLKISGNRGITNDYYCFELDEKNFHALQDFVTTLDNEFKKHIFCYNKGVGAETYQIHYNFNNGNSTISSDGSEVGEIVSLDKEINKKVSLLKMDIEGFEQNALAGAENIIINDKPMCAICVYHSLDDMIKIPGILKEYVHEYKLVIRHHSDFWDDTVCYAI